MEWLQSVEDTLNNMYYAIQYAKVFALGVFICFVILFILLAVQGNKIKRLQNIIENSMKENAHDIEYLTKIVEKQLRLLNKKGDTGNGNDDERSNKGDNSGS